MIVNRTVWLNPVEPHPLSFRAPVGLDTSLNIAFIKQSGEAYDNDVAAQLQLTGRSTDRTVSYGLPATDIVNGRARAIIPAGSLTDPNGYRLRLVGTLGGESSLLAVGSVAPVPSAGIETATVDIIDTVPLAFEYGENVELDVTVWMDSGKGNIYDLTTQGTTVAASIYEFKGGLALMPFTVTILDVNKVRLSLTAEQVNTLPATCWWSLIGANSAGATVLCEGAVTVTGIIVPPLETTVAVYDYQKPLGDVNPVGGQIMHSSITQNMLKVAKTTQALNDLTDTLRLVRTGDTIQIGVTVWSVIGSTEQAAWFDYLVSPPQLAAVDGVTDVTFTRPVA